LISLFIASLGATVVAGHRIVANLSALTYMLPLSLAIATMAALGQAVGRMTGPGTGNDPRRVVARRRFVFVRRPVAMAGGGAGGERLYR
jgi:hypothetical protein